jgi:hypothetical protein
MVIAANAAVGKSWAGHASGILCGLLAGSLFLFGAIDYASAGTGVHNPLAVDIVIMVTALAAAAVASKPVRERAARIMPIDPDNPVHALALALAVILLGTQVASIAFTDVLAAELQTPPWSIGDVLSQELPFLVLALAGIGLWVRRGLAQSVLRLGFSVPAWWNIALALVAAGVFYAFSLESGNLSGALTPGVANEVNRASNHLFGQLSGTAGGVIALAVLPGICEEALFRGALQPRLGLITTAVLFTVIHTEYGLSIDVPTIFVIAIGLGLIRKYTNTTTSCACHVTYNLLVGFGLAGAVLTGAVVVEVLLAGAVAYALWSRRRRAQLPEGVVEESGVH